MADILMGGFVPKREVAGGAHEQREIQMICQGKWQINANTICSDWNKRPANACVRYDKTEDATTVIHASSGHQREKKDRREFREALNQCAGDAVVSASGKQRSSASSPSGLFTRNSRANG